MNLKLWNKLTTNQQLTIIRRNKIALLDLSNMDIYYPVLKTIFNNNSEIKINLGGRQK